MKRQVTAFVWRDGAHVHCAWEMAREVVGEKWVGYTAPALICWVQARHSLSTLIYLVPISQMHTYRQVNVTLLARSSYLHSERMGKVWLASICLPKKGSSLLKCQIFYLPVESACVTLKKIRLQLNFRHVKILTYASKQIRICLGPVTAPPPLLDYCSCKAQEHGYLISHSEALSLGSPGGHTLAILV